MNGGFEDENICLEYQKNCAPEGWISTSLYADYYFDDSANAAEGTHFTGIVISNRDRPFVRNFLRSRLLCGLRPGQRYRLQFSIRSYHNVFDSIGIYFSAADLLYQKDRLAASHPQLFLQTATGLKPDGKWQSVVLEYTATGNEIFINIGDFKKRAHNLSAARPDLSKDYYFFIDSISLTPVNPAEKLCASANQVAQEEYAFDPRHDKLDRLIYAYTKNPPPLEPLAKTILQRVDTLVVPDVLFATASYQLTRQANVVLDSFAHRIETFETDSVVVEGHTDNVGSVTSNQKLSENRAGTVAAFLQQHIRQEIVARGFASSKPVADNRTPLGRQKNRRVEIYLYVRE